jgi:hypothetical protein
VNKVHNMLYIGRILQSCLLLLPLQTLAASSLDGTWEVTFSTRDTEVRQAHVKIAGNEGTWTTMAQSGKEKNDPCVGRPFPVTVVSAEPTHVVLEISFSKVISGCKDRTVTGQLAAAHSIEGKLDNGKPVRMLRK